ncbi:MAG: glycosyltransferase family 4 protein [bacterium]|nr:glycosyltransferase family 4 protein [bacterium]
MKKLLAIINQFPPASAVSVHRAIRFIRYLTEMGWDISVVTLKDECYADNNIPIDKELNKKIPESVKVYRTKRVRKFVPEIPDGEIGWFIDAFKAGKRLFAEGKVDIIYSTAPPWSTHLIACMLKKYTGCPLVVDFRDPWARTPWAYRKSFWQKKLNPWFEKFVVKYADAVIVTTEPTKRDFVEYYGERIRGKIAVIPNGIDLTDFHEVRNRQKITTDKFIITHTGTIYGERNPDNLLISIKRLIEEGLINPQEIVIQLVGSISSRVNISSLNSLDNWQIVKMIPPVSHQECLRFLAESTVLLLLEGGHHLAIPAKLFEYIAIEKPILALAGKKGAIGEVIENHKLGIVVEPEDLNSIRDALLLMYTKWKKKELSIGDSSAIDSYDAKHLTAKMNDVLERCLTATDLNSV